MMENFFYPKEAKILEKRQETADTWTLTLSFEDPRIRESHRFHPGQFNMVGLWGIGEVPISFSSYPADPSIFHHTIRAVGGVTRALVNCKVGEAVGVRGPYGHPWPMEAVAGQDLLIMAGGIGLAPLRPVIEGRFAKKGEGLVGKTTILLGARTPSDLLYSSDFPRWEKETGACLLLTVDRRESPLPVRDPERRAEDRVLYAEERVAGQPWTGRTGVVTTLLDEAAADPATTAAFLCGPEIMMRCSALELRKRGFPADRIYVSLERNMKCAVGQCGHCLFGPHFVCKNGPVFRVDALKRIFGWGM